MKSPNNGLNALAKGCGLIFVGFFALVAVLGVIGLLIPKSKDSANTEAVYNGGRYLHKATSSISRASSIVGNFPTGTDRANYALGLQHFAHIHKNIGDYTIYQVVAEGQDIRDGQQRDRDIARHNLERQQEAVAQKRQAAVDAEAANFRHGEPSCLVYDERSLTSESGEYVGYVKGSVKNTCDRDFSYAQVQVNFKDNSGNLVNSGLANINNLEQGQVWAWKIMDTTHGGTWSVQKVSGF